MKRAASDHPLETRSCMAYWQKRQASHLPIDAEYGADRCRSRQRARPSALGRRSRERVHGRRFREQSPRLREHGDDRASVEEGRWTPGPPPSHPTRGNGDRTRTPRPPGPGQDGVSQRWSYDRDGSLHRPGHWPLRTAHRYRQRGRSGAHLLHAARHEVQGAVGSHQHANACRAALTWRCSAFGDTRARHRRRGQEARDRSPRNPAYQRPNPRDDVRRARRAPYVRLLARALRQGRGNLRLEQSVAAQWAAAGLHRYRNRSGLQHVPRGLARL